MGEGAKRTRIMLGNYKDNLLAPNPNEAALIGSGYKIRGADPFMYISAGGCFSELKRRRSELYLHRETPKMSL